MIVELDDLTITAPDGAAHDTLVSDASAAEIIRTIVGASRVIVRIPDDNAAILTGEPRLGSEMIATTLDRTYAWVAANAVESLIRLTFEDHLIAALRAQTEPIMFTVARPAAEFITRFATEAGVPVYVDPVIGDRYVEGVGRSQLELTNSWQEISTLVGRLGGRVYSDGNRIVVSTDAALLSRTPAATITGRSEPLTSAIAFTIDTNQPAERASFTVDPTLWSVDVGATVQVTGSGPADGAWLVSEYRRILPATGAPEVKLTRPLTIGV